MQYFKDPVSPEIQKCIDDMDQLLTPRKAVNQVQTDDQHPGTSPETPTNSDAGDFFARNVRTTKQLNKDLEVRKRRVTPSRKAKQVLNLQEDRDKSTTRSVKDNKTSQ